MNEKNITLVERTIRSAKGMLTALGKYMEETDYKDAVATGNTITIIEFIQVTTDAWNKLLESKKIPNK